MNIVPQKMADDCIREYAKSLPTAKSSKQAITTAVGFDAKKLAKWLKKIEKNTHQVQIRFGIYTPKHAKKKDEEGRLTVFLCACDEDGNTATDDEGNPIPPVNMGTQFP